MSMYRNQIINWSVWLFILFAVAVCMTVVNLNPILLGLNHGAVKGAVVNKYPDNHLGIGFSYEVDGRFYQNVGYAGQINRNFDQIHIGDAVTVFYDTHRPDNSTLDNPSILPLRSVGQIIAVSLIFSLLGMCILHRYQLLPKCGIFYECFHWSERRND